MFATVFIAFYLVTTVCLIFTYFYPDGPESVEVNGKPAVELEDRVEFICSVSSVPPANITWRINGTVIPGQTKNVLIIENAAYKDSGKYTCEASNSVTGKASASSHDLSVKGKLFCQFIIIIQDVKSVKYRAGLGDVA